MNIIYLFYQPELSEFDWVTTVYCAPVVGLFFSYLNNEM